MITSRQLTGTKSGWLMMAMTVLGAASLCAANTFTAVSGNDWNTASNWSAGHVPTDNEDVVVNGNVLLTNATPSLASLTVNSAKTLTFDGWDTLLSATNVTIAGTVTHAQNAAAETNSLGVWVPNARLNIACDTLTVASTGKIDANAKGFLGGKTKYAAGKGPGGALVNSFNGGSYGGRGATGNPGIPSAAVYGAYQTPGDWPGSGGAAGDADGRNGGNGGGAIIITATGVIKIDGTVSANGENANSVHGGGGSGGGIAISCQRIEGAGTVSAAGGVGLTWGGGGGGGRIAVDYDEAAMAAAALPALVFSAAGGLGGSWNGVPFDPEAGTLWFPDGQLVTRLGSGTFKHSGYWVQPGVTQWTLLVLKMENAWLAFPGTGFVLNVAGDISVKGTQPRTHKIAMTNATIICGGNLSVDKGKVEILSDMRGFPSVGVTGSVSIANAGVVELRGYPELSIEGAMSMGGASILDLRLGPESAPAPGFEGVVDIGGAMTLSGNSLVYPYSHPTNGGTVLFQVASLQIGAGSQFNASGKGYWGGKKYMLPGYGPGAGLAKMGGGYGGRGGNANGVNGMPYGSATAPVEPGSGGGAADDNSRTGGNGGGAVVIESAGAVVLDGSLLADGDNGVSTHAGGGSGGGIYVQCAMIAGSGTLSAKGGLGQGVWGGGGGGGRIALVYDPVLQAAVPNATVRLNATHGSAPSEIYLGSAGTLHLPDTRLLLDANGFLYHGGMPVIPGFTSWEADRIVMTNTYFRLPDSFSLNVTNALVLSGTNSLINRLEGSNCVITCGSLRLDKTVSLGIYGGVTDGAPVSYGARVAVSGDMTVGTGAWVYPYSHPTNGGSPVFTMNNLSIAATGGFDASGRGFSGGIAGSTVGKGPGGGINNGGAFVSGGGGYGGFGGSNPVGYGLTNGLALAPLGPGSGGGGRDASNTGGNGGGLVRIEAKGDVVVDGSLLANGDRRAGDYAAGGSGGGIFLICRSIRGTGTISANGESSTASKYSGGGGGGRIAVWQKIPNTLWSRLLSGDLSGTSLSTNAPSTFTGAISVGIGQYSRTPMPTVGTAVFLTPLPTGTMILVH